MPRDATLQRRWTSWMHATMVLGALGACGAVELWGASFVLSMYVPLIVMLTLAGATATLASSEASVQRGRVWSWWRDVGITCASIVVSLAVVSVALPGLSWLVAAGFIISTPTVRRLIKKHLTTRLQASPFGGHSDAGSAEEAGRLEHASGMRSLPTDELCRIWRATHWQVREAADASTCARLVDLRASVLDELTRRHPSEVATWLSAGHHLEDGPQRYL